MKATAEAKWADVADLAPVAPWDGFTDPVTERFGDALRDVVVDAFGDGFADAFGDGFAVEVLVELVDP